jgi:hypothetical protein
MASLSSDTRFSSGSRITSSASSHVLRSAVERDGLQGDALADHVTAAMKEFLPSDDLLFLIRLSVEPMRARLALRSGEKT